MLTDINETIQGQRQSWSLIKKLGEGDAGEIYLVESLLDNQPAIVKRPRRGAFFSDSLRQANQIKTEGSILRGLTRSALPNQVLHLDIPELIDQNIAEFALGQQTFIVIGQAKGLDLKMLSQIIRFSPASIQSLPTDPESTFFIQEWAQFAEFPRQLLVRILLGVLQLLETIHTIKIHEEHSIQPGVIWNDVKPDHLYWDPLDRKLTLIDWGNSQFLDMDGVTKDRQYSALDDFHQYLQEMGSFVAEANPQLYKDLEWPEVLPPRELVGLGIQPLKEKLVSLHEIDYATLKDLRGQERELYSSFNPEISGISQYQELSQQLAAFGEIPDISSANSFMVKIAYQMVAAHRLVEFQQVCANAAKLPSTSSDKWKLLNEIAAVAQQTAHEPTQAVFSNTLAAGVAGDWTAALWELFSYLGDGPRPDWWEKISLEIRRVCLGLEPGALSLYTMFARLYYTLQAEVARKGNQRLQIMGNHGNNSSQDVAGFHWQASEELVATVREEINKKWKDPEPSPPNSGIGYTEVDSLIDPIEALLPGSRKGLENALAQPKAQVDLVLNAWEQKDFELARRGLRSILIWDPDRLRLLAAEKAIASAPQWLARVRRGASKDEPFYDFLTSVELAGRTLRNRVGPAKWLDESLEALKRLRRGMRSVDLLIEYPEISRELPWLNEYQSREILSLPHTRPLTLERDQPKMPLAASTEGRMTEGVMEGRFGPDQSMALAEPLDTWMPEARGSSARVFAGILRSLPRQPLAFKIMRPDQLDYALPLFIEEIQILTMLRDVPGITPFMECGFIKLDEGQAIPRDESHATAEQLSGQVIHYGVEQAQNLLASMDRQLSLGWLPYLALVRRNPENNLLHYVDASHTRGWFLSLRDSLILALQICDILQFAHDRNIVYRDHKILHYYWEPETHGVTMIDWNIARRQPQGLTEAEKQFDLVQFGARGLHHIFAGRPAQGSLPLGPNRPEDIEKASTHYPVNWTYDDERLPNQLRTILEQTLNQGYTQIQALRKDLLEIYQQLPGSDKK